MYRVRIYMIDPNWPGAEEFMFLDRDEVRPKMYRLVHEGMEDTTQLDELFARYNQAERLNTIKCRSLSVSDIVTFKNELGIEEGYICKMIGWEKLAGELLKQLEENNLIKEGEGMSEYEMANVNKSKDSTEIIIEPFSKFVSKHAVYYEGDVDGPEGDVIIKYTEEVLDYDFGFTRRPVYALRGKPISKELAMHVIRLTDAYLYQFRMQKNYRRSSKIQDLFDKYGIEPEGYYITEQVENHWFARPESTYHGWCHPDGYIGATFYTGYKNPDLEEYIWDWVNVITKVTKELDLVLVVTDLEQRINIKTDILEDHILFGLHVQGDMIELLTASEAKLLFNKYDKEYGDRTKNGPLVDPRKLTLEDGRHFYCSMVDMTNCVWGKDAIDCHNDLFWGEDNDWLPVEGGVDKNNPQYYGVPDYSFTTSPVTMADMEMFVKKFKEEQEQKQSKS